MTAVVRVLFVCTTNICRSAYAEVLTATAAHRRFVLEERPAAVRRASSLGRILARMRMSE